MPAPLVLSCVRHHNANPLFPCTFFVWPVAVACQLFRSSSRCISLCFFVPLRWFSCLCLAVGATFFCVILFSHIHQMNKYWLCVLFSFDLWRPQVFSPNCGIIFEWLCFSCLFVHFCPSCGGCQSFPCIFSTLLSVLSCFRHLSIKRVLIFVVWCLCFSACGDRTVFSPILSELAFFPDGFCDSHVSTFGFSRLVLSSVLWFTCIHSRSFLSYGVRKSMSPQSLSNWRIFWLSWCIMVQLDLISMYPHWYCVFNITVFSQLSAVASRLIEFSPIRIFPVLFAVNICPTFNICQFFPHFCCRRQLISDCCVHLVVIRFIYI